MEALDTIRCMAIRYGDDQIASVLNRRGYYTGKGVGGGEIPRIDGDVGGFEDGPSAARLPSCSRPSRTRGAALRWPCGHP
jgi:hypothetical protein